MQVGLVALECERGFVNKFAAVLDARVIAFEADQAFEVEVADFAALPNQKRVAGNRFFGSGLSDDRGTLDGPKTGSAFPARKVFAVEHRFISSGRVDLRCDTDRCVWQACELRQYAERRRTDHGDCKQKQSSKSQHTLIDGGRDWLDGRLWRQSRSPRVYSNPFRNARLGNAPLSSGWGKAKCLASLVQFTDKVVESDCGSRLRCDSDLCWRRTCSRCAHRRDVSSRSKSK